VLVGVAQGQAVQVLADQLDLLVADALRIAPVQQPRRQVGRQPQAMIDLTEEQGPGVGSNPRIGLTQLDGAVKGKLEQPSLAFTHWIHLRSVALRSRYPLFTRRNGA